MKTRGSLKHFVKYYRIPANPDADPPVQKVAEIQTTGAIFQINNAKICVPDVTLSVNDNITFLENIMQGFTKTIFRNK